MGANWHHTHLEPGSPIASAVLILKARTVISCFCFMGVEEGSEAHMSAIATTYQGTEQLHTGMKEKLDIQVKQKN